MVSVNLIGGNMKHFKFILMAVLALVFVPASLPAVITIDSVTGTWNNVQGNPSLLNGVGTNEIRWGIPTEFDQSGYRFDGNAPPFFPVNVDVPFTLGQFTHFNEPIFGDSITGTDLNAVVDLTIDGVQLQGLQFNYSFLHDETPNIPGSCAAGSVSVCDDIVEIVNNFPISDVFEIDGEEFTIEVLGFEMNGDFFEDFMTEEGETNIADLRAIITKADVEIPEPSTYLMMGTFLGLSMLLLAYRKKTAKQ